jgi:two-component system phosphate regulon sensor histidine kinase PhoR
MADSDKVERYASLIFDQNNRMKSLVEHVLQVSSFDRHEYQINRSELNLHDLIDDIVASFSLVVEERGGELVFIPGASSMQIVADKLYLTNILSSLVDNAIKYSPDILSITISTRSDSSGIYISVTDKGLGMNNNQRRMVFQKFYRVSTGNRHNVKGYGLGLYNAMVLAKAHGGTLTVSSEPGKGSTFTLFLPFVLS